MERWARAHPVERALVSRASIATYMAECASGERDAFVAVGEVSDTIESLSQRLNTYAAELPKQARWQAEILLERRRESATWRRLSATSTPWERPPGVRTICWATCPGS